MMVKATTDSGGTKSLRLGSTFSPSATWSSTATIA